MQRLTWLQVFEDLAGRFERPDTRSRWDSPLFEYAVCSSSALQSICLLHTCQLSGLASNDSLLLCMNFARHVSCRIRPGSTDRDAILADVVRAMLAPAGSSRAAQPVRDLAPNFATSAIPQSATNLLTDIDRAAQAVIGMCHLRTELPCMKRCSLCAGSPRCS